MSVLRGQDETAETLEIGMVKDSLHQEFGDAAPTMLGSDEDIGQVGKRGEIANDTSEARLLAAEVRAEAERMFDRSLDDFARDFRRPIGSGEKSVDEVDIQARFVRGDFVRAGEGFTHGKCSSAHCRFRAVKQY